MTKSEMRGIWDMIGAFRGDDPKLRDKSLMSAWWMTFQPYDAKALEEAVAEHFRRKKFFPDIAEIRALLPPLPEASPPRTGTVYDGAARSRREFCDRTVQRWSDRMEERGYPARLGDHMAQGKPADEWWLALGECQLQDEEYMALFPPHQREQFRQAVEELRGKVQGEVRPTC